MKKLLLALLFIPFFSAADGITLAPMVINAEAGKIQKLYANNDTDKPVFVSVSLIDAESKKKIPGLISRQQVTTIAARSNKQIKVAVSAAALTNDVMLAVSVVDADGRAVCGYRHRQR